MMLPWLVNPFAFDLLERVAFGFRCPAVQDDESNAAPQQEWGWPQKGAKKHKEGIVVMSSCILCLLVAILLIQNR